MDKYCGKLSKEYGKKAMPAKKRKMVARKYSENYLQFGFILTKDLDFPSSLFLLYSKKLSSQAMVLSKLKHLEGKPESVAHKDEKIFLSLKKQNAKQPNCN